MKDSEGKEAVAELGGLGVSLEVGNCGLNNRNFAVTFGIWKPII